MAQYRTDVKKLDGPSLVTRFEVQMLNDRLTPSGTLTDAFGRLRVSQPFTLFDSSHRYSDNGLWVTSNTAGTTYGHANNQSIIALNLDTTANSEIVRETTRVFSYQPGKSLLILNTFVMDTPKTNLRQRVGYFGSQNGIYLENDGTTNYFVLRTFTSGAVQETKVPQSEWNIDKFDGTGYSAQGAAGEHGVGLDVTKTNILWIDIEWLGVGDVRCGFVVDGALKPAHIFHNDNLNTLPYMTTASLPIRYEIKNTGITSSNSTLKQICSSVQSEGGYELFGRQQAIQTPITAPVNLTVAGTYYPILSIQLKSARLDAIVILTALSLLGIGNNGRFNWQVISNGALTSPNWTSAGNDSAVEYDQSATAIAGGRILASGFLSATTQASQSVDILKAALFKFQLERNSLTGVPYPLTLAIASGVANDDVLASLDWEEISR